MANVLGKAAQVHELLCRKSRKGQGQGSTSSEDLKVVRYILIYFKKRCVKQLIKFLLLNMYIQKTICSVCFTIDWQNKKDVKFTTKKTFYCSQSYVNGKHFHFVVLS